MGGYVGSARGSFLRIVDPAIVGLEAESVGTTWHGCPGGWRSGQMRATCPGSRGLAVAGLECGRGRHDGFSQTALMARGGRVTGCDLNY